MKRCCLQKKEGKFISIPELLCVYGHMHVAMETRTSAHFLSLSCVFLLFFHTEKQSHTVVQPHTLFSNRHTSSFSQACQNTHRSHIFYTVFLPALCLFFSSSTHRHTHTHTHTQIVLALPLWIYSSREGSEVGRGSRKKKRQKTNTDHLF